MLNEKGNHQMPAEVRWFNDQYRLHARVYPFGCEGEGCRTSIDVYREGHWSTPEVFEPAQINWPCIGAQSSEVAYEFAEGLTKAVEIAAQMNLQPIHKFEAILSVNTSYEQRVFSRTILGNNREQVLASIHTDADCAIVGIKEVE